MKINESKLNFLEKKKEDEKQKALVEIFGEEAMGPGYDSNTDPREKLSNKREYVTAALTTDTKTDLKDVRSKHQASKKANEIWDETAIVSTEDSEKKQEREMSEEKPAVRRMDQDRVAVAVKVPKELPAVRSTNMEGNIKLEFTERIFPTLAMRESQLKDAPAPKLRQLAKKADKVKSN